MQFRGHTLRSWSRIVLMTMLFAALAPAMAHAFDRSGADRRMQVCTSAGTFTMAADASDSIPSDERGTDARAACAFCLAGAHAAALPMPLRLAHAAPVGSGAVPPRAAPPHPTARALVQPAQPRAPPASC